MNRCPYFSRAYGVQCELEAGHVDGCVNGGDGFASGWDPSAKGRVCSVSACGLPQHRIGSGWVCKNGHGGAAPLECPNCGHRPPQSDTDLLCGFCGFDFRHDSQAGSTNTPATEQEDKVGKRTYKKQERDQTKDGTGAPLEAAKLYYVQDTRSTVGNCALFWGKDRAGYVCDIREAGHYHGDDVQSMRETDVGWPIELIHEHIRHHIRADAFPLARIPPDRKAGG